MTNINYFTTKEDHDKFIKFWKALATDKKATFRDHILYCLLKNKPLVGNAFTPVTNKTKLACNYNGNAYYNIAMELNRLSYDVSWKQTTHKQVGIFGATRMFSSQPSATVDRYGIWTNVLTAETKEKLKMYFDNNTVKSILGIQ
jgi:hypothetical protein